MIIEQKNFRLKENLITQEAVDYSVKVSSHTFKTIFSHLYANKERAIVRELMANGYDSQVRAGRANIPLQVHLPSALDPTFSVRDFGVSMTHDFVRRVYTAAFDSDKGETNDEVGAFGLGSKTPFSLTDSFQVICFLNNEKRVYLASMTERETPKLSLLHQGPTDEPDGVLVSMPVGAPSIGAFRKEAAWVAQAFDVWPEGIDESERWETTYNGASYRVADTKTKGPLPASLRLIVQQGVVMYPVLDTAKLVRGVSEGLYGLTSGSFIVQVPIGTFQVSPSRETLSLDASTQAELEQIVLDTFQQYKSDIARDVSVAPNRLTALRILSAHPTLARTLLSERRELPYQSGVITSYTVRAGATRTVPQPVYKDPSNWRAISDPTFPALNLRYMTLYISRPSVVRKRERLRQHLAERKEKWLTGPQSRGVKILLDDPSPQQLRRLVRLFGLTKEQVVPLASLPDPGPRTSTSSNTPREVRGVYKLSYSSQERMTSLPDKFYFLPKAKSYVMPNGSSWTLDSHSVASLNEYLGLEQLPLLLLTKQALAAYSDKGINWSDAVTARVEECSAEIQKHTQALHLARKMNYPAREVLLSHWGIETPKSIPTLLLGFYTATGEPEQTIQTDYPLAYARATSENWAKYFKIMDYINKQIKSGELDPSLFE